MGAINADSFSGYGTSQIPVKLTGGITGGAPLIQVAGGRNGNNSLRINDSGSVDFILKVPTSSFILTNGFKTTVAPAALGNPVVILNFFLSPNIGGTPVTVASIAINNLGGFTGVAGGTSGNSANSLWFQNSYAGLGLQIVVSVVGLTATTTLTVYLNGNPTPILTVTGSQTIPATSPTKISDFQWRWQVGGQTIDFSDAFMIDMTDGVFPTTFPGDVFVSPDFSDANGVQNDWTALAGSNFSNINEHPPDGDTSYVKSNTVGNIDVYHFPAASGFLPGGSSILGVQHNVMGRKDNSGTRAIAPVSYIASDASFHLGDSVSIGDTYDYYYKMWSVNPKTNAQWLIAEVAGAGSQFGQKVIS